MKKSKTLFFSLLPRVTLSREEFIQHIIKVCQAFSDDREKEWVKRVESELNCAHYFEGIIFIEYRSSYLLIHELMHHISRLLRYYTQSKIWHIIDWFVDNFDIWLFYIRKLLTS